MRTGVRSGDHLLARRIARDLRKNDRRSNLGELPAHALQACAYVAAKFYSPRRALPLLEAALSKAQAENHWGLEQLCRTGIGAVLRQLGRYRDSIAQLRYALALARKTLDPSAEASRLMDIGVAEMALGNPRAAEEAFFLATEIEDRNPSASVRAYLRANCAELALMTGDLENAERLFQDAYELASHAELWSMRTTACAGLAMCAHRRGNLSQLKDLSVVLQELTVGRETFQHDRWMLAAATTWNRVLNLGEHEEALRDITDACRELARRDVDHWLCLELETIRIREYLGGRPDAVGRERLAELSKRYAAAGIEKATRLGF